MTKLVVLISVLASAAASRYSMEGISSRIIDGTPVKEIENEAFQVALSVYPTKELKEKYCNGALISNDYVLTAASCFDGLAPHYVTILRFGAVNLEDTSIARIAINVKIHTRYNSTTLANNIAVIHFRPVPLTDENRPPRQVLRSGRTSVITNALCKEYLENPDNIIDSNICTTFVSGNARLCSGDEGSSLYITENGLKILIGIGSQAANLCRRESIRPAVFTRVTSYFDWISASTGIIIPDE